MTPAEESVPGWRPGHGWGWVWGDDDERGALNALTDTSRLAALTSITQGRVYDLGVLLDRRSFLSPSHPPTQVLSYRTAHGMVHDGLDPDDLSFNTTVVTLSDHAGTQLDGLCHAAVDNDLHWYNGYSAAEWSRDFGPEKAAAHNIEPVVASGVLVDVPSFLGVDELDPGQPIGVDEVQGALDHQSEEVRPGDVVLVRTGTLRHWGDVGESHEALSGPDTAGITLATARWLVEEKGAVLVGADNTTLECVPHADGGGRLAPVHRYLLAEQGVHIGELHYLEELSADGVSRFCYIALTPKVRGTTAGFAMRPIALV